MLVTHDSQAALLTLDNNTIKSTTKQALNTLAGNNRVLLDRFRHAKALREAKELSFWLREAPVRLTLPVST